MENPTGEEACHIVRRMLRYRGGATAAQVALRYGWTEDLAREVQEALCRIGEVVSREEVPDTGGIAGQTQVTGDAGTIAMSETDESEALSVRKRLIYYHAELYKRARKKTLWNRREEIFTCPPEHYAALLLSRIRRSAPGEECLKEAIVSFAGMAVQANFWEEVILPTRVRNYREGLLDSFLAEGEYFWHLEEGGRLRFDATDRIDWDTEPEILWDKLSDKERLVVEALQKRGASFLQALNNVLSGESPHDTLLSLVEKGIVSADSFVPVRQWLNREKVKKATVRQRVNVRVKALQAGRFDLVRSLRQMSIQEQMDGCFDRYFVLCKEAAAALTESGFLHEIQDYALYR